MLRYRKLRRHCDALRRDVRRHPVQLQIGNELVSLGEPAFAAWQKQFVTSKRRDLLTEADTFEIAATIHNKWLSFLPVFLMIKLKERVAFALFFTSTSQLTFVLLFIILVVELNALKIKM